MTNPNSPNAASLFSPLASDPDLSELVEMYVEEMPERIATIQNLLDASDWESLRRFAHQVKGAAGSYGFDPISPVAGTVEDSIREGAPEEAVRRAVEELLDMCARARAGMPE